MPRERPYRQYQAPQAPNAQAYGQRGEQIAAQQAMPLPQTDNKIPSGGAVPSPTAPPGGAAGGPQGADLLQMAAEFDPGITPLSAPSGRPGEPVTAGLSRGAGPGPEIFEAPGRQIRAAETLELMARVSGDDTYLRMAERIRQGGGYR